MAQHFDLFVIGGGSGGVACARRAASHGAKVGLGAGGGRGGRGGDMGGSPHPQWDGRAEDDGCGR